MARRILSVMVFAFAAVLLVFNLALAQDAGPQAVDATALGTAFTYQGQLKSGGVGVTGSCEMVFRLLDAALLGHPVGVPVTQTVTVNAGLFTTQLDFGAGAFDGQARWLETAVKCGSDTAFTTLSRQALTAAPYALYAQSVNTTTIQSRVTGVCGAGFAVRQVNANGSVTCEPITGGGAHDHWAASWIGTGTGLTLSGGIIGLSGSGSSYGVQGQTSGTTGYQAGVRGETASTGGWGVHGYAVAISGTTFGVGGVSDSTAGTGVFGSASAISGTTYGVYGQVASPHGWAGYFTGTGNGVYINAPQGKVGLNVTGGGTAQVDGNIIWHAGNDGPASGLSADLLDGQHGNYYLDASNIQAGTLSTGNYSAYSDLSAEGYLGNASGDLALNNGTLNTNLNADLLDGYSAGNANGNVPVNNGTLNTNLNADLLDGQSASAFAASAHSHDHGALTGLTDDDHTQYFNLSQNETVTGIPAFNGGTSGVSAPFAVDSTTWVNNLNADLLDGYSAGNSNGNVPVNNSTLNTNLNADLLDGQSASAFATSAHNHWGTSWSGTGTGLTLSGGTTGLSGSGSLYGVLGQTSGASGYRVGVRGETTSTGGWGVAGVATAASGTTFGVGGVSDSIAGTGVYGSASASSGTTYGVYGTATSSAGSGVYGTAPKVGTIGIATDFYSGARGVEGQGPIGVEGTGSPSLVSPFYPDTVGGIGVWGVSGPQGDNGHSFGVYGEAVNSTADYGVYSNGNFAATGSKAAVVPTKSYGWRHLYSMESPDVLFEDVGTAQLKGGEVKVAIDPIFAETINLDEPYQVFLTAQGSDFVVLVVAAKDKDSFTVRGETLDGKPANCTFDYRIIAKRLGYENDRMTAASAPARSTQPTQP